MHAGFAFSELDEDLGSSMAHFGRELRLLQNLENRAERAVLRPIFGVDHNVGGSHAVFPDFFGAKLPPGDLEAT